MRIEFGMDFPKLHDMERATKQKARKVLYRSFLKMEELAKRRCPVDSGELRRSINLSPRSRNSNKYTLADGVYYGVYVEYGTARMIAAHGPHDPENPVTDWEALRKRNGSGQTLPFFRPALLEVKRNWMPKYWNEELSK